MTEQTQTQPLVTSTVSDVADAQTVAIEAAQTETVVLPKGLTTEDVSEYDALLLEHGTNRDMLIIGFMQNRKYSLSRAYKTVGDIEKYHGKAGRRRGFFKSFCEELKLHDLKGDVLLEYVKENGSEANVKNIGMFEDVANLAEEIRANASLRA